MRLYESEVGVWRATEGWRMRDDEEALWRRSRLPALHDLRKVPSSDVRGLFGEDLCPGGQAPA